MSKSDIIKICIIHTTDYSEYESMQTIVYLLPDYCWIDVTEEEYEVYCQYVTLKNYETRANDGRFYIFRYFDFQHIELDITYEKALKLVEKNKKEKEERSLKNKIATKKRKATTLSKRILEKIETLKTPIGSEPGLTEDDPIIVKLREQLKELKK